MFLKKYLCHIGVKSPIGIGFITVFKKLSFDFNSIELCINSCYKHDIIILEIVMGN